MYAFSLAAQYKDVNEVFKNIHTLARAIVEDDTELSDFLFNQAGACLAAHTVKTLCKDISLNLN